MNAGKLSGEGLRDALAFSALEGLLKDRSSRQLALGQYLLGRGKLAAAELCFEQAIRESKNEPRTAVAALIGQAEIYKRRKSLAEAHKALMAAQDTAAKLNDPKLIGVVCQQQAEIASVEGCPTVALEKLMEAREAFARAAEAAAERTQIALKLGLACQQLLQFREALVHFEEAEQLAIGLESDKSALKVLALVGQASVLPELGRAAEGLRKCTQAEELLDHDDQNSAQFSRLVAELKASCFETLGELKAAAECYERALTHSSDIKERARICAQLALLKFSMGCPQEARKHEEQALVLINQEEIPEALLNLSQLNLMRGQIRIAGTHFVRAIVELSTQPESKADKRRDIALKLHHASLDLQRGMLRSASDRATSVYEELLAMVDGGGVDVEPMLPSVLHIMGNLARLQGQLDEAEGFYQQALDVAARLGMRLTVATTLGSLAQVTAARFEMPTTLEYLEKAIAISQDCGAELYQQALLVDQVSLLNQAGKKTPEESIAFLQNLLRDSRRLQCLPLELAILTALAMIHRGEAHFEKARECLQETVEKASQAGMEFMKIIAEALLGTVFADLGEGALAEQYLSDALTAMEQRGLEIEAKYEFRERYRDLTGFWF